ncbi:GNAT family N-acetyltransferase [Tamlana sp. 2201CG12-4]|uniref:GNAT family N-acetyltransferase n=1 Tax=Tamlana sp. 2201CG12-4 TaxID=3112582 RepID=UPI002DB6A47F|nr:GNAT family N-acetyltransferase [Tamlana sp. 2201CG12-4]MEC3908574.1 GNAT family N-acetyltransferase [Tamlana sp. 2201CG12-4]
MVEVLKAKTKSDFIKIESLADTIWRAHYIPIVGKPQIDYMLDKFQSVNAIEKQVIDGFEYFILNHSNIPVGYIAIRPEVETLFLSKIYVLSHYRGQGIGKLAMDFVKQKAKTYDLDKIRLTVNINNTNSIKAYEKLGFKNIGPLVTEIGNGFVMDDYEMVKLVKS